MKKLEMHQAQLCSEDETIRLCTSAWSSTNTVFGVPEKVMESGGEGGSMKWVELESLLVPTATSLIWSK